VPLFLIRVSERSSLQTQFSLIHTHT
jgi:hypothetical protein